MLDGLAFIGIHGREALIVSGGYLVGSYYF